MKTSTKLGIGAVGALAVVGALLTLHQAPEATKHEKRPPEAVHDMTFPQGLDGVVGDESGKVCHKVILRTPSGDKVLRRGIYLPGDWRKASEAEKEAWVKEAASSTVDETGNACLDDPFFSPAYADPPTCLDCGGGCISWSCPATLHIPLNDCTFGGQNCVISVVCCGGDCEALCG